MSNKYKTILRLIVFLLSLMIAFKLLPEFLIEYEFTWAMPILVILSASFVGETWVWFLGRKTIVQYFNGWDKIVFIIAFAVILLLFTMSENLQLSRVVKFLLDMVGLGLGWLIIHFSGSANMRKALVTLPYMREKSSNIEEGG